MQGIAVLRSKLIRVIGYTKGGRRTGLTVAIRLLLAALVASSLVALSDSVSRSALAAGSGGVHAWGNNSDGQLGDGTTTDRNTPVNVKDLWTINTVAAGGAHSLALKSDSTVWAWGFNGAGQLGDGTTTNRNTPVSVKTSSGTNLSGIKAIAAGTNHSLALKSSDGTVKAWGDNIAGQLGDGTTTNRNTAVTVKTASGGTLSGIKAIAAGSAHSLALKGDSTVRAWGDNSYGQLGDGTHFSSATPVSVRTSSRAILSGIKAIAAGWTHSLAARE